MRYMWCWHLKLSKLDIGEATNFPVRPVYQNGGCIWLHIGSKYYPAINMINLPSLAVSISKWDVSTGET